MGASKCVFREGSGGWGLDGVEVVEEAILAAGALISAGD